MLSSFSHVWLFATLWTVVGQTSPSIGFSRQENWSELACPPPGDLPNPGIEPPSHVSCIGRWILFPLVLPGKLIMISVSKKCREIGTLVYWCRKYKMFQPLCKAGTLKFLKNLNTELPCDPEILLLGMYPREMKTHSQKDLCMDVCSSLIHNSQWLETIQNLHQLENNKMKYIHSVEYYLEI